MKIRTHFLILNIKYEPNLEQSWWKFIGLPLRCLLNNVWSSEKQKENDKKGTLLHPRLVCCLFSVSNKYYCENSAMSKISVYVRKLVITDQKIVSLKRNQSQKITKKFKELQKVINKNVWGSEKNGRKERSSNSTITSWVIFKIQSRVFLIEWEAEDLEEQY